MDDPDGRGGYRGWANRLAERIAEQQAGSLLYANLAVRGRTTRQILDEQLEPALAMKPDLATVVAGMNDVLRRGFDEDVYRSDLEAMQRALVKQGATVLTFTIPDPHGVMPLANVLGDRIPRVNDAIRAACRNTGAVLFDLAAYPVASDPRLWSDDRLHANAMGHARIAEAVAHTLGIPADANWHEPYPDPIVQTRMEILRTEMIWAKNHLLPWIWRHMRGRSSGDGITAKRPVLAPV